MCDFCEKFDLEQPHVLQIGMEQVLLWLAAAIGFQSISNFSFALNAEHPD